MSIRKGPLARKKVQLTVEDGTDKNPLARERPRINKATEDQHGNSFDYIKPIRATKIGPSGAAYGATAGLAADDLGDLLSQAHTLGEDGEFSDAQFSGIDMALAQFYMEGHEEALDGFQEYFLSDD